MTLFLYIRVFPKTRQNYKYLTYTGGPPLREIHVPFPQLLYVYNVLQYSNTGCKYVQSISS